MPMGRRLCCCAGTTPTYPCFPCNIPLKNLTVSWTNSLVGNGSATLVYTAGSPPTWSTGSACPNQMVYSLQCSGGSILFQATGFTSGGCPGGTQTFCGSLSASPNSLVLSSSTCSPFSVSYTLNTSTCPILSSSGYTSFTITDP